MGATSGQSKTTRKHLESEECVMVMRIDSKLRVTLMVIAVLLAVIALRPYFAPLVKVEAQSARFDHVFIVSTMFLYKGAQGLLVLDRRNGNVWFIPKASDSFQDPVFILRIAFEKLDQAPR
jgi:hypothetical protein